jgi:GTP-binding protein
VAEADVVMFVVDVRAGLVGPGPRHRQLPALAAASKVLLAVNKAEGMRDSPAAGGVPRAGHRRADARSRRRTGRASAACWKPRWKASASDEDDVRCDERTRRRDPIRLAVAGRPNVGK